MARVADKLKPARSSVPVSARLDGGLLSPVSRPCQQIESGRAAEPGDLVGRAGLNDELLDIQFGCRVDRDAPERPGPTDADAKRCIDNVAVEGEPAGTRLGVAHPRHTIEVLEDLQRTDVDLGGSAFAGDVAV
jgi:hypothetical protein